MQLQTKVGAGSRIRTDDLLITNQLLYQLSYAGKNAAHINAWRRLKQVADCFVGVDLTHTGNALGTFGQKGSGAYRLKYREASKRGLPVLLSVDLLLRFVVLHETSVRSHLETRLLPAGFDNNLVIPLPIRVVFPDYPNDVSAC
jgi:hypothetical protein